MAELVAAAVVAHQPMVMVPEEVRVQLGGTGADTTLVEPGYRLLREQFAALAVDTIVIIDTHWYTTTEHVIAGASHFSGLYTSDEMPRNICELPYDYPGAPELAAAWHRVAKSRGLYTVNVHLGHEVEAELKVWVVPTVGEIPAEKKEADKK